MKQNDSTLHSFFAFYLCLENGPTLERSFDFVCIKITVLWTASGSHCT